MNTERLTKLAELLDKVVEERKPFNLYCWTDEIDRSLGEGVFMSIASASGMTLQELSKHECGTVACAVGHACLDPWFNEQGLVFSEYANPTYQGVSSWFAVQGFFGISYDEARHLFAPESYDEDCETPASAVAASIREFIALGDKP